MILLLGKVKRKDLEVSVPEVLGRERVRKDEFKIRKIIKK